MAIQFLSSSASSGAQVQQEGAGDLIAKQQAVSPTPSMPTGITASQTTVTTTWKPDLSQPNPYLGMPIEYAILVAQTYVATQTQPLNPVQMAALKGQIAQDLLSAPAINELSSAQQGFLGISTLSQLMPSQITAIQQGLPIPVVTSPTSLGVTPPSLPPTSPLPTTWKPDFNKANPYEGAPLSYFQLEMAGYIPTAQQPLPPSLSLIQNNPNTQLVAPSPPLNPQQLTPTEYRVFQQSTPEKQFQILMDKGYVPQGSQFAGYDMNGQIVFYTPETLMRKQLVELWNKRVGVLQGLSAKQQAEQAQQQKDYQAQVRNFETKLKDSPKELQDAYAKGGIEAYNTAVDLYNQRLDNVRNELASYRTVYPGPYQTGESFRETYDIPKYLADNKFSPESVALASSFVSPEYVKSIVSTKEYWTPDGRFNSYAALVGGISQDMIKSLTGEKVDVSVPPPFKEFAYVYYQQHPIMAGDKKIETDENLTGIGQWNYPAWYSQATKRYEEIYGHGSGKAALIRGNIGEIVGGLAFQPAEKMIEPKYGVKSVSGAEWLAGGIQIGMWVAPFALGKIIPIMPKIADVRIPTTEGESVIWKGLTVADRPIIGKSGGTIVLGRNIELPEASKILAGYKPEAMLDTRVFVNPAKLKASGFSDAEIEKLTTTLKDRNLFAGEVSPYLAKDVVLQPTARLNSDEINVLAKQMVQHADNVYGADLLYGSATIKSQLAPELRTWRDVHDWDIRTMMSQKDTEAFAQETLGKLQGLSTGEQYRIPPDHPTLIEKYIDGKWEHIADIHSKEISPLASEPVSKVDTTGVRSYGRLVSEPAVTIDYPGIGKIDIMTLSESGVRKADTILRVRGTEFYPPERGIAAEGVPKDVADFYVILRTFKGKEVADEFARLWNLDPDVLFDTAMTDPPKLQYRITPSKTSVGDLPSAKIIIPDSLKPTMTSGMIARINEPASPSDISAIYQYAMQSNPVPSRALVAPVYSLPSPSISSGAVGSVGLPSIAPSSISPSAISPKITSPTVVSAPIPSPSTVTSPKAVSPPSASVPPSVSSPSGVISPKLPSPTFVPTPVPSAAPIPVSGEVAYPSSKPVPPIITPQLPEAEWSKNGIPAGTIEWRQGVKWEAVPPPYDKIYHLDNPLPGTTKFAVGKGSAYKTLQVIGGPPEQDVDLDLGWAQVHIDAKGKDLRMSFGGGEQAANDRWDMERQAMSELERQSYEETPQGDITQRIPRSIARRVSPVGLEKVELPQYRAGKWKVYLVNGEFVRSEISKAFPEAVNFTQGGHSQVYDYVPPNEIWLDRANSIEDRKATLLHEMREVREMSAGKEYEDAHEEDANLIERQARHNPSEMDNMLAQEMQTYHVPVRKRVVRQTQNNDVSLPVRTYLGRRLRPVALT